MRTCLAWLLALAPLWACAEQPTQALVTLDLDEALRERVSSLSVESLDARDRPTGTRAEYALQGPKALRVPFSFGAVPREDDYLKLRIVGYDKDDEAIIEQRVDLALAARRATPITLVLSEECAGDVCGDAPQCKLMTRHEQVYSCASDGSVEDSCERDPFECACENSDACRADAGDHPDEDASPDDLDAGAAIDGSEDGFMSMVDGTADAQDTDVISDPEHDAGSCVVDKNSNPWVCKNCKIGVIYCPFQGCVRGPCLDAKQGYSDGTVQRTLDPHRMYGQQFYASMNGRVVGLGVDALSGGGHSNPLLMIGLYESLNGKPSARMASTPPFRVNDRYEEDTQLHSVHGGVSYPVSSSARVRQGSPYWLFVIANEPLTITSQANLFRPWQKSITAEDFAKLNGQMPLFPFQDSALAIEPGPNAHVGDLYLVTLPD